MAQQYRVLELDATLSVVSDIVVVVVVVVFE